jgi:hypothetical protein
MKRIVAILLMGLLFFNWYGYQLVSGYLQDRADRRLEASLDQAGYDQSQLISIKVPLTSLSYYNSSTNFERVDGQIEVNGILYKYVKRRIYKDSLEMLCIPNSSAMGLAAAKNAFFQQVNDLQQNTPQGKKSPAAPHSYKGFSKDYCSTAHRNILPNLHSILASPTEQPIADRLPSRHTHTPERPPDGRNACLS